jgi:hypothetical protein
VLETEEKEAVSIKGIDTTKEEKERKEGIDQGHRCKTEAIDNNID